MTVTGRQATAAALGVAVIATAGSQFQLAGALTIPKQALTAFTLVGLASGVVFRRSGVDAA